MRIAETVAVLIFVALMVTWARISITTIREQHQRTAAAARRDQARRIAQLEHNMGQTGHNREPFQDGPWRYDYFAPTCPACAAHWDDAPRHHTHTAT